MLDWRLTIAWLGLAGLGSLSGAALTDGSGPAMARALPVEEQVLGSTDRPSGMSPAIVAHRASDGLFYATLSVNGRPVRFLIDTGATHMVLSAGDARRVGAIDDDGPVAGLSTAGGMQAARWTRVDVLEAGSAEVDGVHAIVTDGDLPASLLGQDVLSRLGPLQIDGDQLIVGKPLSPRRTTQSRD